MFATLAFLEADVSAAGGLATAVGATGLMIERRFDDVLPKLLMRLKKRLVRLPLDSSVDAMDAAPERTSSVLAGVGPGVDAFERPKDLRRRECRERWSGDGGLAGIAGIGGRKA